MSDSWSFSPCCHSETFEVTVWQCRICGSILLNRKRVFGTREELLKKYHTCTIGGAEQTFVDVCSTCASSRVYAYMCRCDKCGKAFHASELIVEVWEDIDEY